jgi:hypothetical protein
MVVELEYRTIVPWYSVPCQYRIADRFVLFWTLLAGSRFHICRGSCVTLSNQGKCDRSWMEGYCCETCFGCNPSCKDEDTVSTRITASPDVRTTTASIRRTTSAITTSQAIDGNGNGEENFLLLGGTSGAGDCDMGTDGGDLWCQPWPYVVIVGSLVTVSVLGLVVGLCERAKRRRREAENGGAASPSKPSSLPARPATYATAVQSPQCRTAAPLEGGC